MADVFILGIAVTDFVFSVVDLPSEAAKYRADTAEIVGGGCAANAAVAVARLGGRAALAAPVGDDPLADIIVGDLAAAGVMTKHMRRIPGGRSSFSSVFVDAAGERQIVNFRGSGLISDIGWLDDVAPADAVLVDTRRPEEAAAALDMARDWGVPGILDGEPPTDPALLQKASHVALSRAGLRALDDRDDPAAALAAVARDLSGWVCVTDGENGVYHTDAGGITHVPGFPVAVVDTLGAGDVWHGAFALALAEGRTEAAAVVFANAAAALKCMKFGGRAGCPDRARVENFLKETA